MAKVFVVLMTLIMLGVWGWMSWVGYKHKTDAEFLMDEDIEYSISNCARYVFGLELPKDPTQYKAVSQEVKDEQSMIQIALGVIVAFSATQFFAVTGGSGAIFSVMVTAFVAFFTAAANMVFALSLLVRTGWAVFGTADPVEYQLIVYGVALYGLLTVVTAFTVMRQMPSLVRGKRSAMHAVMKCLVILLIASAGLAPLGIPEYFVVYGYHGAYWLAGLCLLSLLFIALTHGNYEYD